MDTRKDVESLLSYAENREFQLYLAATGAGLGIANAIWQVPGISRFLVGAEFPYAKAATDDFLGFFPESYCSQETAMDMAMASYLKALDAGANPVGFGLCASVATLHEHRGAHRFHMACITKDRAAVRNVELPKGSGYDARQKDGMAVDDAAIQFLTSCVLGTVNDEGPKFQQHFFMRPYFNGRQRLRAAVPPTIFFPGSFNPPHSGHHHIADAFERQCERSVTFSIAADPPHKEHLSVQEMLRRVWHFHGHHRVLFTRGEPFYIDKFRRYSGEGFILGADAVLQMIDPKWGLNVKEMMDEMARLRVTVYVVGRSIDGKFIDAQEAIGRALSAYGRHTPPFVLGMFRAAPWCKQVDISSTEVRAGQTA